MLVRGRSAAPHGRNANFFKKSLTAQMSGDPQAPPSLPLFASDAFPSCDSRGVWFFERRKPMCALVVVVAALWLLGPLVGALLLVPSFAWWIRAQRVVWRAQVRASRTRAYRYALHSGGARAAQAAAAYAASHEHVAVVALQTFDPWLLLVGSVTVALHLDDADEPHGTSRLVQWLGAETATRMLDSASNGWRENIVYTPEGLRRSLFVRLVCSVHDCSDAQGTRAGRSLAERVRCVLEQCCALCVDDACRTVEALPSAEQVMAQGDVPSWPLFWSWLWGCPCCSQRQFAQLRTRPSNVRTSVLDVLRAALSEPTASRQLMRHASSWLDKWVPWSWVMMLDPRTWFELVPLSSFVYHRQAPFPMPAEEERFECAWGDTHLLLEGVEELLPHIAPERYVVTHHMTFAAHLGRDTHTRWEWEAHAWFEGHGFVLIRHPYTHATHAYQLDDQHMATLLRSMVPGAPADATDLDVTLVQWLVASHVWVLRDTEQDVAGDADLRHQRELREQGWTVVPQHQLVPLPYLNALRAYYKSRAVRGAGGSGYGFVFGAHGVGARRCTCST